MASKRKDQYIIEDSHGIRRIAYADILYLAKDGKYTVIYALKDTIYVRKPIKRMVAEMQGHDIIQTDKSYAVNMRHVLRLKDRVLIMRNQNKIPISIPRYHDVKEAIRVYWSESI